MTDALLPVLRFGAVLMVGAAAGSFATTAAMRAATGRPWVRGRSACDACGITLGFASTTPLLSYAACGGRCGSCRGAISPLHPLGEVAGAAIAASIALWPLSGSSVVVAGLGGLLLFAAVFDLLALRIPDWVSLSVAALGGLSAALGGRLIEGAVIAGLTWLLLSGCRLAYRRWRGGREGLGGGDVKLLAALALWLGSGAFPWALGAAALLALSAIAVRRLLAPQSAGSPIAFAPFIGAGAWIAAAGMQILC